MKVKRRQSGLTLTEMAVVVATIALLVGIGLPAVRALLKSFESESGAKTMVSSALASARAIAAKEQSYAGIRFQEDLDGRQYMVFVIQNSAIMAYGFQAVEGINPIKLPDSVVVTDLTVVSSRNIQNPVNSVRDRLDDPSLTDAAKDALLGNIAALTDTETFSVIFSPAGKMVIHGVRVRNKDGKTDDTSNDGVFNIQNNVDAGIGMFYQDDYPGLGLGPEGSRSNLVVCDRFELKRAFDSGRAWSDYLVKLEPIYINAYTGTMISTD